MHWQAAAAAFMRPYQKRLFMLGSLALHLVPVFLIGLQWQEFRWSAAAFPREQVLRVNLLSPAAPGNEPALFPGEASAASGQGWSALVSPSSTPVSETEKKSLVQERPDAAGVPSLVLPALPLPYLNARELDERPWAEVPVLIPFPETTWEGGRVEGILELFIGEDGSVDRILVKDSTLPEEFEAVAVETFRGVKMQPGIKEGKPVRSIMKILVEFEQR